MLCWARYLFIAIVTVLGVGSIVSACGQKGALYLPDEPAVPAAPVADVPVVAVDPVTARDAE
ncbi:lipoprotein [Thioalkalicoccus limnaeus]|uniref:Lipoprotein n=1 Tax=Thioalkalicoccus limnaeus TaxID=120681 RepID=A0ABV4BCU1_9GAMM